MIRFANLAPCPAGMTGPRSSSWSDGYCGVEGEAYGFIGTFIASLVLMTAISRFEKLGF